MSRPIILQNFLNSYISINTWHLCLIFCVWTDTQISKSKELYLYLSKQGWLCSILPSNVLRSVRINSCIWEWLKMKSGWKLFLDNTFLIWNFLTTEIQKWYLDACYMCIFIFTLIIAEFDYLYVYFMIFKHYSMQHWHENYANVGKLNILLPGSLKLFELGYLFIKTT